MMRGFVSVARRKVKSMVLNLVTMGGLPALEIDIVERLRALEGFGTDRSDIRDYALELLRTTQSAAIRNAAALALSDLRAVDAVKDIAGVILKPGVSNSAGTLLYAIEELGGDLPLSVFVHVLVDGSYEARQQALDLLVAGHVAATEGDNVEELLAQLEPLLSSGDDQKAAAAAEAVGILRCDPDPDRSALPSEQN